MYWLKFFADNQDTFSANVCMKAIYVYQSTNLQKTLNKIMITKCKHREKNSISLCRLVWMQLVCTFDVTEQAEKSSSKVMISLSLLS